MARPYTFERVQQLRNEGKGTNEIMRIIKREELEYAIEDIEDIADVRRVLHSLLEHIRL